MFLVYRRPGPTVRRLSPDRSAMGTPEPHGLVAASCTGSAAGPLAGPPQRRTVADGSFDRWRGLAMRGFLSVLLSLLGREVQGRRSASRTAETGCLREPDHPHPPCTVVGMPSAGGRARFGDGVLRSAERRQEKWLGIGRQEGQGGGDRCGSSHGW